MKRIKAQSNYIYIYKSILNTNKKCNNQIKPGVALRGWKKINIALNIDLKENKLKALDMIKKKNSTNNPRISLKTFSVA